MPDVEDCSDDDAPVAAEEWAGRCPKVDATTSSGWSNRMARGAIELSMFGRQKEEKKGAEEEADWEEVHSECTLGMT